MKGKEIIEHINRAKMPDIEQVRENCVLLAAPKKQETKRRFYRRRAALSAASALLIVCLIFASALLASRSDNAFTLKASAVEQEDGAGALDLPNGTYYNGKSVFIANIKLEYDGKNIESLEFFTDSDCGLFAEQYMIVKSGEKVSQNSIGDSDAVYPLVSGNKLTLDKSAINGKTCFTVELYGKDAPSQITIRAVATFTDGKTQEKTYTVSVKP